MSTGEDDETTTSVEGGVETPAPAAEGDKTLDFAGSDGATMDAFERAITRAVQDKLGDLGPSPGPPRAADELLASVFSALSGKDAKSALSEVRDQLAQQASTKEAGTAPRRENVIDLQAAREKRQRTAAGSPMASKLGDVLKDTFNAFMANKAGAIGDGGKVTLDANFLKQHGPSLLGNLFQGLAGALIPAAGAKMARSTRDRLEPVDLDPVDVREDGTTTLDGPIDDGEAVEAADAAPAADVVEGPADPAAPAAPDHAPGDAAPVQVKLDLGSILASLFRPRQPAPTTPPAPPAPTPPSDEV